MKSIIAMLITTPLLLGAASASAGGAPGIGPMRGACRGDVQKLCPSVSPGGGRIVACLKQHHDEVSQSCLSAMQQMRARRAAGNGGRVGTGGAGNTGPGKAAGDDQE